MVFNSEAILRALRPVTIRQMLDAKQLHSLAHFTIDGYEIDTITTVAHVLEVEIHDSYVDYHLEDGGTSPGQITARHFHEENQVPIDADEGLPYARIIGQLESRFENNCVKVKHIRKVIDPHEVYFHFLEALVATRYLEIGPPPPIEVRHLGDGASVLEQELITESSSPPSVAPLTQDVDLAQGVNDMDIDDSDHDDGERAGDCSNPSIRNDDLVHLTALQRGIIEQIRKYEQSPDGAGVRAIARGVRHLNVTAQEVEQAFDLLTDKAYIVTTIDLSHYKLTKKSAASTDP
ncbi:hypothetical protein BKA93DRAFT_779031 [Sparassis latifolia]|uniref:Replication protein A C-terminal domain-containing protein n=1 Tax=Sparassis crispa TaxID=139825 RepID=A0A401GIX7_9APHY|nr:predicted protein [Sparassis crispa]GBE82160.1 predicted protein [Sparassis crispa]